VHGTTADVSEVSASLRVMLFFQQAACNGIAPLINRKDIWLMFTRDADPAERW